MAKIGFLVLFAVACLGAGALAAEPTWILSVTLSGAPFVDVGVAWTVNDAAEVRASLSLGLDLDDEKATFVLWGRLIYAYYPLPGGPFYFGGGLGVLEAFPEGKPTLPHALVEVPLGLAWPLGGGTALLGEARFTLPLRFLGFSAGLAF